MNKSKKIFAAAFVIFLLGVVALTIDMCSRTEAPWKRKKEILEKKKQYNQKIEVKRDSL